ncbi:MAG: N-formylglutamate deformylase [Amphiplicatus sp.]
MDVIAGAGPVVLGQPHSGLFVPEDVYARLNDRGRSLVDTDWHVGRLYEGLLDSASVVRANFHRYVIDANRDPSGASLYPGQNTTGLVPLVTFDNEPIWFAPPTAEEISQRSRDFHAAYHAALSAELDRVKAVHGVAVLYDCHSIRSTLPYLFDGVLPDLYIGDNGGATCGPSLRKAAVEVCAGADTFTYVVNGRFRGGWTTRHYGRPSCGVHAIQMEIAQSAYLAAEAPPFRYDEAKAETLRQVLRQILKSLESAALSGRLGAD